MPVYEYECTKCHHKTEIFQKISDPPITECELCHGKMKKLISQSTFHLKGTGWYVTDYASKSGGYDGKGETGDKSKTKSTAEAKGVNEKPGNTKEGSQEKSKKPKGED